MNGADIWRAGLSHVDALVIAYGGSGDFKEVARQRGRIRSKLLHQFCAEARARLEGETLEQFEAARAAWALGASL